MRLFSIAVLATLPIALGAPIQLVETTESGSIKRDEQIAGLVKAWLDANRLVARDGGSQSEDIMKRGNILGGDFLDGFLGSGVLSDSEIEGALGFLNAGGAKTQNKRQLLDGGLLDGDLLGGLLGSLLGGGGGGITDVLGGLGGGSSATAGPPSLPPSAGGPPSTYGSSPPAGNGGSSSGGSSGSPPGDNGGSSGGDGDGDNGGNWNPGSGGPGSGGSGSGGPGSPPGSYGYGGPPAYGSSEKA